MKVEISVVIPTKDRVEDLYQCIWSVLCQSVQPAEIIVVDDGRLPKYFIDKITKEIELNGIIFKYIRKDTPSLSISRNIGFSKSQSPVILLLDDDVVLDMDYIRILEENWERYRHEKYLGGIGGVIKNLRRITMPEKIFHKVFMLSSPLGWDITDVGFQVWDTSVMERKKVFYLPGGITSFKKSLIREIPFKQINPGKTPTEDVDFFMRVKNAGYFFIIDPRAKVFHKISPVARENDFRIGEKEGYNQCVIFKDNVEKGVKNYLKFFWSGTGWILRQFFAGHILKAMGMIVGCLKNLTGRA